MAERKWKIKVDADKVIHIDGDDFEVTLSAVLTFGDQAVEGRAIQLFAAGEPMGNPLETDSNGRVTDQVVVCTSAKNISIEAQAVGFATRDKRFIALPRPEVKPKAEKLLVVSTSGDEDRFYVRVARVNHQNIGLKGPVVYLNETGNPVNVQTDEFGEATVSFAKTERPQTIKMYIPGKPEEKIVLSVKEKRFPSPPKKAAPSLWEKMKDAYKKGERP